MPRYKLTIEYNGTNFIGWQKQKKGFSIQGTIEKAAKNFLPVSYTHLRAHET